MGRPRLEVKLRELILRMTRENPRSGCVLIRGELLKLGYRVSATAIRNLLRREKLGPAPTRSGLSWKAFLKAQASAIVVSDFFTVLRRDVALAAVGAPIHAWEVMERIRPGVLPHDLLRRAA